MTTRLPLVAIASAAMLTSAALARPPIIDQGWDYLLTTPDSYMGFEPGTTLPMGFFGTYNGMPSDPLALPPVLPLTGRPLGIIPPNANRNFYAGPITELAQLNAHRTTDGRLVGDHRYDTIVQRLAEARFNAVGDTVVVPIRITDLSLQSVFPVPVSFGGGTIFSDFEVNVGLDPDSPSPLGLLNLTLTSETGGTLTSTLPVNFRTTFRALDPVVMPSGLFINGQIVFDGAGVWSTVPAAGPLALVGLAGAFAARRRRPARDPQHPCGNE